MNKKEYFCKIPNNLPEDAIEYGASRGLGKRYCYLFVL